MIKVLQRDRFTCCKCGASPAIKLGVELHVDHVILGVKEVKQSLLTFKRYVQFAILGKVI